MQHAWEWELSLVAFSGMAVVTCLHFSSTYRFSRSCDSDKQVPNSSHATKKTLWRNVPVKPFLPLLLALPWPTGADLHLASL
jgi:hypothetical protein